MGTWIILACSIAAVTALPRYKRRAYELPAGADLLVGNIQTTFSCPGDGYYADVDNDCKVYHLCHTVTHANAKSEVQQWSFMCGNLTVFNQLTLTCSSPEDVPPCSKDVLNLNDNIGLEDNLTEQGTEKTGPLLGGRLPLINRKFEIELPVAAALPPDIRIIAFNPIELVTKKAPEGVEAPSDVTQEKRVKSGR
ncbi:uncharacterized protein LOC143250766 isoform X2 [Tachypleus tridentatus]|uniref:uncharacterized protein LOC143250766 isoform X2 n=1 Tax=Tachypleus tridentatus TaxID=6853 RepID=UPI003FD43F62